MRKVRDLVERGKQVGSSFSFLKEGQSFWITLALQKLGVDYIAHVALISEKNMDSEKFEVYETRAFSNLEQAISYLQTHSPGEYGVGKMSTFKGQKAFNPLAEEVLRDR